MLRLLSSEGQVNFTSVRKGYGSADACGPHPARAANSLAGAPIWIDDTGTLSIRRAPGQVPAAERENGLDLVVVDYLQLMHRKRQVESRQLEIAEISRCAQGAGQGARRARSSPSAS